MEQQQYISCHSKSCNWFSNSYCSRNLQYYLYNNRRMWRNSNCIAITDGTAVLGGGTFAWSSSNTLVATIDAVTGLVTAVAVGSCNIIYTITGGCGGTVSALQALTVSPDANAGTVSGTSPLCIGATTT